MHNGTLREPYVRIGVPFAACKRGSDLDGPERLLSKETGVTETCAPVSTRKRVPESVSVTNSCGSRGPAIADAIVGPPWRFPVSWRP